MSIGKHHNEWLSLLEVSGPFLSIPVLMRVFPQGLDARDTNAARNVRLAFAEWEDQRSNPAIHTAWIEFVLKQTLDYPPDHLLGGQSLPAGLEARVTEHGETLRPTFALKSPAESAARLLISVYPPQQGMTQPVARAPWKTASPDTRMMTLLHATGVPLGLVTNGEEWMLVAARSGETTTYVTWDAGLWTEEPLTLRSFCALLGTARHFGVAPSDTLPAMLAESAQNQQEVTDQLGAQVRRAVEVLIQALDRIDQDQQRRLLRGVTEKTLYEAALTFMMRLVFLLSAEERGLLLLGDPLYDRHYAVSSLRGQLREVSDEMLLEHRHDAWSRLLATFRAVFGGVEHAALRLPAYGGALFDPDRYPFLEGRPSGTSWQAVPAQPLPVSNRTVLHLLESLQFLQVRVPGGGAESRRLSFRALDIEQIGHVYEGLLDHTAKRAQSPVLGLRAGGGDDVEVELAVLEAARARGDDGLVELLKEKTGRSPAAIRRALNQSEPPNPLTLRTACGSESGLYSRVAPFSHLLRDDSSGYPVVIHKGSVYVTAGHDRRSTGTHYTPRSLTEPIVKTTLDPLLYDGVDRGEPAARERLKPVAAILAMKVCDPACGSGAFLVQACRYLAERLVEAWDQAEAQQPGTPLAIPEALPGGEHHGAQLLPRDAEERLAVARRLVCERCLYGVDVNPMAVEMAKLSLWLITLHRNRPFTFLDHAIKCGDSLVGLHDPAQIKHFHLLPSRAAERREGDYLYAQVRNQLTDLLDRARHKREQLERFTVLDMRDAAHKARLHGEAEAALDLVRVVADLVVGAGLATAGSNEARSRSLLDQNLDGLLDEIGRALGAVPELMAAEPATFRPLRVKAAALLTPTSAPAERRPFHWLVEFPEVFLGRENSGFDAVIGNPPFVGGQKITGLLGTDYRDFQVLYQADGRRGSADLCAYFFLRAARLLRSRGNFGMLAVNTIAEGDTRQVGLEAMLGQGFTIFSASPNFTWPGAAAVVASSAHLHRGDWRGGYQLSGRAVSTISAFLSSEDEWSPKPLKANGNKSFQGSIALGLGFLLDESRARDLIVRDPRNSEVIVPFVAGDQNARKESTPGRWVITFWDWPLSRGAAGEWQGAPEKAQQLWLRDGQVPADYPGPVAQDFPTVLAIVEHAVKPERLRKNDNGARKFWWRFLRPRPELYHAIGRGYTFARHPKGWNANNTVTFESVLVAVRHTKYWCPMFLSNCSVFSDATVVFATDSFKDFAILQSSMHSEWAWKMASSIKDDLRYAPSDAYETFPFPAANENELSILGKRLHSIRATALAAGGTGMTEFYNRFHNPDVGDALIQKARDAWREIDQLVLCAYGWHDVDLGHDFHAVADLPESDQVRFTVCHEARLDILRRLSRLNRERWNAEQHEESTTAPPQRAPKPHARQKPTLRVIQGGLFDRDSAPDNEDEENRVDGHD